MSLLALMIVVPTLNRVYAQSQTSATLKGKIYDKTTGETVIGAVVNFESIRKGGSTDINGDYMVDKLPAGKYSVKISCMSYKTIILTDLEIKPGQTTVMDFVMEDNSEQLNEVIVTSVRKMNTELAMIQTTKTANVVMSGISGRQISKSPDRNAAEVVKRVPGVSIVNDRYIVVRGLASRYNSVWLNNSSVPSTEADNKSFSFDMLPSSQLENIMIVKSPSSDLPADFAGGFVKIHTKGMPDENSFLISYSAGANSETHFGQHFYNTPSKTDVFGFDNERNLRSILNSRLDNYDAQKVTEATKNGFRNDWSVKSQKPIPDQHLNLMFTRYKNLKNNRQIGYTGALNYSYSSLTYSDVKNSRFGVYNNIEDKPEYLYDYTDNQYSLDAKIGAMFNLTYLYGKSKIEFRNLLNQHGKNRYTTRDGFQNISARYNQSKNEYLYTSRTTYTGLIAGEHNFKNQKLDWIASYSYAGMNQPDRRIINREENTFYGDPNFGKMGIDQNEITRDYANLDENLFSATINYTKNFDFRKQRAEFKAGLYSEYKYRTYRSRYFTYRFNQSNLPADFQYQPVVDEILSGKYFSSDKLYIYEDTDNRNSYKASDIISSGYASVLLPFGKLKINAGLRLEAKNLVLTSYTSIYTEKTKEKDYTQINLFPSFNATYELSKKHLIRLAYGMTTNRQEFRELSSSVYYDFNLFSDVKGNPELKPALIQNIDVRYEFYPSADEYLTFALFYKNFRDPIEWTYLDAGGSYTYTFENAKAANNYGVELDMKKNLSFIGLKNFSLGMNVALISSKVMFDKSSSLEKDRPMQGQSPYLVNTSLFYDLPKYGFSTGLLYNRIGERIVGIGRVDTSSGATINNDVPNTYETPRDVLDFVISKKIGKSFEIKANIKDMLNQKVQFVQYPKFYDANNQIQERKQVSKEFKPGSYFMLSLQYSF